MGKIDVAERLAFIAKKFDVFETAKDGTWDKKEKQLHKDGYAELLGENSTVHPIGSSGKVSDMLALMSTTSVIKTDSRDGSEIISLKTHVSVSYDVFVEMLDADPTDNKMYLQWMLNVFTRLIKILRTGEAIQFANEDLPQAKEYIALFEANKRKKKFRELCESSYVLKDVKDATNINQYKSLSQLFDAVDPFIDRDPTEMGSLMQKYVDAGQAEMPVKDRNFTLYIPKTREANIIFDKFSNWCTAKEGNGMFDSYTNNLKPNGKKSDIYIIVDNGFFTGESDDIYQIHFESKQIRSRKDSAVSNFFEAVINKSEGLSNYFHEELMKMAKSYKKGVDDNFYIDFLIKFGFAESLFEFYNDDTPYIRLMTREVPKMPDIGRFSNLDQLVITDAKMVELHPSIGKLQALKIVSLSDNRIANLPSEIGYLKNLKFIGLCGNPLESIPDTMSNLDTANGGKLERISVFEKDIGESNYMKLKRLLPNVEFN